MGGELTWLRAKHICVIAKMLWDSVGSMSMPSQDDRFGELEAFVEVSRTLSMTLASRRLDVAISSISRRLARLEERLGVQLVRRTTRAVHLTDAGVAFLPECIVVLEAYQRATDLPNGAGAIVQGHVRLSLPNSFGRRQIVPLLPGFGARYAGVDLGIEFTDRFVDLAAEGFDLAIGIGPQPPRSLATVMLGVNRRLVCAAPEYLARVGIPAVPQHLAQHQCLGFSALSDWDTWTFTKGPKAETVTVNCRYRANDSDALRELAIAGEGIVILAEFNASDDIAAGRLCRVLEDWRLPATSIFARLASDRFVPSRIAALVDYIQDELPAYLRY